MRFQSLFLSIKSLLIVESFSLPYILERNDIFVVTYHDEQQGYES